ncbi:uncharacterized protein LOC127803869 isoform X2 [Diospyros lotus]|uniref:uncharacterized protein LOC127803869 isoform X2 n=1 Tax=Diospyros lotus TaxID=55363 RepID=UPI0022564966|nr:uncharacterized protein LOC127803869 isoform X2 [Diospyros lotus]
MPHPQPNQQPRLNDMQMLQQHIMLKQLQELQRHQLQELGDQRQQNYFHQLSATNKQASRGQFLPPINGTPIHDSSQTFRVGNTGLMQHGASPAIQELQNGFYSEEQNQDLHSLSLLPRQLEVSLYGTPIARNNLSHLQGFSNDSIDVVSKASHNQMERPRMQKSDSSSSFLVENCNASSDQLSKPDGAFLTKQIFHGQNLAGEVPSQGFSSGTLPENFQQVNTQLRNTPACKSNGRQEQAGWPQHFTGDTTQKFERSQGVTTLDPLEQKILFNMDDSSWTASFGRTADMGSGGLQNTLEHAHYLGSFPSIQSGSWSALMQSAVAESSSTDTGLQEEWSGLSFQNTEVSTDNQPSSLVHSGKQQTSSVDNNVKSASSLSGKPQHLFSDTNMISGFPGFEQSGAQFSIKQKEGMLSDSSHESVQQSQPNQPFGRDQLIHTIQPLGNEWPSQNLEHSQSSGQEQSVSPFKNCHQPFNKLMGSKIDTRHAVLNVCDNENAVNKSCMVEMRGGVYEEKGPDGCMWITDKSNLASSITNSVGGLEQAKSGASITMVEKDLQLKNFAAFSNSVTTKVDQATSQHAPRHHQFNYLKHVANSVKNKGNEIVGDGKHHPSRTQVLATSYETASETYEEQQNFYQREKSSDVYHPNGSQLIVKEDEVRENMWTHESDSQHAARANQNSSGQGSQGLTSHEQGYFGQFNFVGDVSKNAVNLGKEHLPDTQRNLEAADRESCRENRGANVSAPFHESVGIHSSNLTCQTRQNMLELLHKVDHSGEQRAAARLSSTDSSPLLDVPEAETSEASMVKSYDHSSVSPHFGLRLAPPTQRLSNSNSFLLLQSSPQSANSTSSSPGGPLYLRNQFQRPFLLSAPVAIQSPQATLMGMPSRTPQFNHATPHGSSQQICINSFGQQLPILDAVPVSQPSLASSFSHQLGSSTRLPSVRTNLPTQLHLSGTEHDKNSKKGMVSLELGAGSLNPQVFDSGDEHLGKKSSQQQIPSEMVNQTLRSGGLFHEQEPLLQHVSEVSATGSGSLMVHSEKQNDTAWHPDKQMPTVSARDIEAFGRSLKPSNLHPSYSLFHQMRHPNNVATDPSRRISDNNRGMGSNPNVQQATSVAGHQMMYANNSTSKDVASRFNSFPTSDDKMLSFSSEVGDVQLVKDSPLPHLRDTPEEIITQGQSYSHSDSGCNDVALNSSEHSQISMQMAPSWFKHYSTLKMGHMLPMYDTRSGNNSSQQFPLQKPFENLHMNSSVVQVNVSGAGHVTSVWPITATTLAAGKLSPPCVLPPDVIGHNLSVTRSKKRKIAMPELLPWHKEVTQGSKRLQTIRFYNFFFLAAWQK